MCTSCNLTRSLRFHSIANGVPSVFASSLRFVRATSTPHGGMRMDIVRLPHPLVFRSTPTPSRSVPHDPMQSCRAVLSSSSNHPVSLHRAFSFSPFFLLPSRSIPLCLRKHPVKVAFPTFLPLVLAVFGREQHVSSLEQGDKFETGFQTGFSHPAIHQAKRIFYVSYVRLFRLKF